MVPEREDSRERLQKSLHSVIDELSSRESYGPVYHRGVMDEPMPSVDTLMEVVTFLRSILFPGFFVHTDIRPDSLRYYLGSTLDRVSHLLAEQIQRGYCFSCEKEKDCRKCTREARRVTGEFIKRLPVVRSLLADDARAAYLGDPAARSVGETIFCYPSVHVMTNHRIAHELYQLDVPLIPRIISERAHSETGIDIHPGATIGSCFFIDHGTGTVIGETCEIGNNVRIYQGVTLGAKSFPLDEEGNPVKGIKRHPVVEDDVIIYSGATILGNVRIGKGAVIGGNLWITGNIPPGMRVIQQRPEEMRVSDGLGI